VLDDLLVRWKVVKLVVVSVVVDCRLEYTADTGHRIDIGHIGDTVDIVRIGIDKVDSLVCMVVDQCRSQMEEMIEQSVVQ